MKMDAAISEPITLRCPRCKRTQDGTKRKPYDPEEAVIREVECPTCDPVGGWHAVKWYDANGNRLFLNQSATE